MTTKKILDAADFAKMDVHRPVTAMELNETNPQAQLDRTLHLVENAMQEPAPLEQGKPDCKGPFVNYPENVHVLDVSTTQPFPPERVLQMAYEADLLDVLVVGRDKEGEIWAVCSEPNVGAANLLCDLGKQYFLDIVKNKELEPDPRGPKTA